MVYIEGYEIVPRLLLQLQKEVPNDVRSIENYQVIDNKIESAIISKGIAKRLRKVGQAAPIVAASISGTSKEENISSQYGGTALEGNSSVRYLDRECKSYCV